MVLFVAATVIVLGPSAAAAVQEVTDPAYYEMPTPVVPAAQIARYGHPSQLSLQSSVALVLDEREGVVLLAHNIDEQRSIASLTKLMTAVVTLDANLPFDKMIEITPADGDHRKGTSSRLRYGSVLTRYHTLLVALAASDNRAAAALARTYPGGYDAMIAAMNAKAWGLGMLNSRYVDPTGLDYGNVSTARDLAKLITATRDYALLHSLSTRREFLVTDWRADREIVFRNTNFLLHKDSWNIVLSKTGYTAAAGKCLLIETTVANRPLLIVLLNSWGELGRYGDSDRIRNWLWATEHKIQTLHRTFASY